MVLQISVSALDFTPEIFYYIEIYSHILLFKTDNLAGCQDI